MYLARELGQLRATSVPQGAVEGMLAGEGYRELLLAKVLVGEAADLGRKTDRALKFPAERGSGLRCACGSATYAVGRQSPGSTALAQAIVACRYDTVKGVTSAPCQACLAAGQRAGVACLAAHASTRSQHTAAAKVAVKAAVAAAVNAAAAGCNSCTSTSVYIVCETPSFSTPTFFCVCIRF